jgi:hypothetical protein
VFFGGKKPQATVVGEFDHELMTAMVTKLIQADEQAATSRIVIWAFCKAELAIDITTSRFRGRFINE